MTMRTVAERTMMMVPLVARPFMQTWMVIPMEPMQTVECLCYAEDVYTNTVQTVMMNQMQLSGKDEVFDEADIDENCNGQADEMNAKECDVYFYDYCG